MREVAALSGTSLKTVSRVFNSVSTVDPKLVAKVEKAAKKLNYTPNMTAGSLRRTDGKTNTIAILFEDISNPFSASLHRAYEDIARERGYVVFAGSLDEDPAHEHELVKLFISRRVDGLVIAPSASDHSYLKPEQKAGVHFGFVDRPPVNFAADTVLSTNREGSKEAVAHLIAYGHKRIAFIGDDSKIYTAKERFKGYESAMKKAGLTINKKHLFAGDQSEDALLRSLKEAFQSPNPPTAIFTGQNVLTLLAIRALKELKLSNKVALIGYDDIPAGDLLSPAISLVRQDVAEMGRRSAELLFRRIDGYTGPVVEEIVPTTFTPRGSGEIRPS